MLTILEYINLSTEYLKKKGIEDPRINAELLLCKVLNCKKINLYLNFDQPLSEHEVSDYRNLIKRRGEREPLQYITGSVEFYELAFDVNPGVLIPRPETEIMVEKIIVENKSGRITILDIGTGSGNIAVSLAFHLPDASITAIDKSDEALKTASQNAINNSCSERISFQKCDIFSSDLTLHPFDVVVSNPPYISEKDFVNLEPELRIHEPKIALTDQSDGLAFYRRIMQISDNILNKDGRIYMELGQGQSSVVEEMMRQYNFSDISIVKDYQGIDRVISGVKK